MTFRSTTGTGGSSFSQYLQYTTFTVLPESTCYLAANIICSQPKTGISSVEGGDSGGPLVIFEDGTPTQVGVNVFTAKAGNSIWQGSTRVSDFLSFIHDNTGIPLR
jgi:secreted trypsin-like serine protease